jgi:ketosteroid isomerase-like protein
MNKLFTNIIIVFIMTSFSNLAYPQSDIEKEKEALKQVDIEFSNLSLEKGMNFAFLSYAAHDGVLLRPKSYPIEGIDKIKETLGDTDTSFTLAWNPLFAAVSESLDLGYTYGIYELTIKSTEANPQVHKGTYLTIWKKDKYGNWKFVLDTGNAGLGEK